MVSKTATNELLHAMTLERSRVEDEKLWVDAEPLRPDSAILYDCLEAVSKKAFDAEEFYRRNFCRPDTPGEGLRAKAGQTMEQHIAAMWPVLRRHSPADSHTLLGLAHPYIVPGERFREPYYWDSYYTMLGLAAAGDWDTAYGMVENCADQIGRFGYVPNGARTYYLGRSQPPVFSHMVRLIATHEGQLATNEQQDAPIGYEAALVRYLVPMMRERSFWMEGAATMDLEDHLSSVKRVVRMPDGNVLNRYYDASDTPRPESYRQDVMTAARAGVPGMRQGHQIYRDIRAAAESGHDFSGRWLADGRNLHTIGTTDIVPIDLNCLLYDLEMTIAEGLAYAGEPSLADAYKSAAAKRAGAINAYMYDPARQFYFDYNVRRQEHTNYPSLAAAFVLQSGLADDVQAGQVGRRLESDFLLPGGFASTLQETGQQWDGENAWAPLQAVAVNGLQRYGFHVLAGKARDRWVDRNRDLFDRTGQLHEKVKAGDELGVGTGGEYQGQTGFGWTNGVLLHFLASH